MLRFFPILVIFFWYACSAKKQDVSPPNIVVIIADDLGWGDVGYHGSEIRTPNIDKLAKEGVELNRFYTTPICSPTRAGLLTGRYPDRYGLRNNVIRPWLDFGVDTTEVLLPEILEKVGYKNRALVGKWHLGHSRGAFHPMNRGFSYFYGHLNGAIGYFDFRREGQKDWHDGFKVSSDTGYTTDLITKKAVNLIEQYVGQGSPFFLQVAYNAPHSPLQAQRKYLDQYGFDAGKPRHNSWRGSGNTARQTYSAMVTNLDDGVGEILDALQKWKIGENTFVFFMSDNGAEPRHGGSSGMLRGEKHTEWEGGVRTPAVVRWPVGFQGGWQLNEVTSYIDLFPTIVHLVDSDFSSSRKIDGVNIIPLLQDRELRLDRDLFIGNGVVVNRNWKLVETNEINPRMKNEEDLLFHISEDPYELNNLKSNETEVYSKLRREVWKYKQIKSSLPAPSDRRPDDFVAPKNWTIQ